MIGGGLSNHEPLYRIALICTEMMTFSDASMTAFEKNRLGDSVWSNKQQYYQACS